MIPLRDVFSLLASGEFANIAINKDRRGNIDESEYNKVIGHINLALVEIYKRFNLIEEEIKLHAFPATTVYYLRSQYMTTADKISTTKYIEQSVNSDGFLNIVEIKDIFDEDQNRVTMNNRFLVPAVRQISYDQLKITGLEYPHVFSILYQAHPSLIILNDDFDINTYNLDIPRNILEAVLYYVAARVYKPIGANNSTANADKSSNYEQKYELSCQKIDMYGLDINNSDEDPDVFTREGWV